MVDTRRFIPINIAVLTVSDTRTLDDDKSGDLLEKRIKKSGHVLTSRLIIPDEKDQIVKVLENWISEKDVDVIISTGGTGLTGRDVTIEAHKLLYDKEITAFQTVFSIISMNLF